MNKTAVKKLRLEIALLLKKALGHTAEVSCQDAMITIIVSTEDFEHRFGVLLDRIQRSIDRQYPVRPCDIALLIRDAGSRFGHVFKIWRTAEC